MKDTILHGACVARDVSGRLQGALLRGRTGSGKSDLAFRLIREHGFRLIGDDQVAYQQREGTLYANSAAGNGEALCLRGIGTVRTNTLYTAPVRIIVDLVPQNEMQRHPGRPDTSILGVSLPLFRICAHDAAATHKIILALEIADKPDLLLD